MPANDNDYKRKYEKNVPKTSCKPFSQGRAFKQVLLKCSKKKYKLIIHLDWILENYSIQASYTQSTVVKIGLNELTFENYQMCFKLL